MPFASATLDCIQSLVTRTAFSASATSRIMASMDPPPASLMSSREGRSPTYLN